MGCCSMVEEDDAEEELSELFTCDEHEDYRNVQFSESLTMEQRKQAMDLVDEYRHIFTDRPNTTALEEHKIILTTDEPVRQKPYYLPYSKREAVTSEIQRMLEAGVIEQTVSPYASPIVLVKKRDGTDRFCIDFRRLNRITVFDAEPMPTADDIFAKLRYDTFFSKLDLSKGYWQIPMRPEDKPKTAFVTQDGIYQFRKMPFGLVNATATFNRLMRRVLCDLTNADSFVDDVLAHTENWDAHVETLRRLFERLSEAQLNLRPSKCCIGYKSLDFIGHRVGEGVIRPQTEKLGQIKEAARPTTKRQVRSFLGLVGYYRKFIPNFASIAVPLTDLTKKMRKNVVEWTSEYERAFQTLKEAILKGPVLKMPDFSLPFYLQTDASEDGAGAALLQIHGDTKHPIAYFSKKFSQRERSYSVIEKECLALVWGIRRFQVYLYGVEFILETDHQPLAFIDTAKLNNMRIMRWSLFLQSYKFRISAIKGCDNVVADYLSRL